MIIRGSVATIAASVSIAVAGLLGGHALAADLPPHDPLRILIVSDEVNPHGLSAAQLTQPGDISAALTIPGSGLNLDVVTEVATDDLPDATAALSVPFGDPTAYDVVIYFAHRIPNGGSGAAEQAAFVTAVDDFLVAGGGFISFHHGSYTTAGKTGILDIIGATAGGAVPWDTVDGQNVINVAPSHFITSNAVEYSGTVGYADPGRGVAAGTYAFFNNTPDERYPQYEINPGAGTIEVLFGSNYDDNGTTHLLGFTHRRPAWAGVVVAYQPGEYQPNALDDLDGNNFQILANAIVYAAGQAGCDCDDDGDPCTQEACGGSGCEHQERPATTCDADWQKASLQVKETTAGKEKLDVKLKNGPALAQTDFGNPLVPDGTAYTLCLYDAADALAGRLEVDRANASCGTRACWKTVGGDVPGGKGYAYRDSEGSADGVRAVTFKGGVAGASKLQLKGKNVASKGQTALPTGIAAALEGSTHATVQLHADDVSRCFSAVVDDVTRADADYFKARH